MPLPHVRSVAPSRPRRTRCSSPTATAATRAAAAMRRGAKPPPVRCQQSPAAVTRVDAEPARADRDDRVAAAAAAAAERDARRRGRAAVAADDGARARRGRRARARRRRPCVSAGGVASSTSSRKPDVASESAQPHAHSAPRAVERDRALVAAVDARDAVAAAERGGARGGDLAERGRRGPAPPTSRPSWPASALLTVHAPARAERERVRAPRRGGGRRARRAGSSETGSISFHTYPPAPRAAACRTELAVRVRAPRARARRAAARARRPPDAPRAPPSARARARPVRRVARDAAPWRAGRGRCRHETAAARRARRVAHARGDAATRARPRPCTRRRVGRWRSSRRRAGRALHPHATTAPPRGHGEVQRPPASAPRAPRRRAARAQARASAAALARARARAAARARAHRALDRAARRGRGRVDARERARVEQREEVLQHVVGEVEQRPCCLRHREQSYEQVQSGSQVERILVSSVSHCRCTAKDTRPLCGSSAG